MLTITLQNDALCTSLKGFWDQMQSEIAAHMEQTYTWVDTPTQQADNALPESHVKIGAWLTDVGVNEHLMTSKFLESGCVEMFSSLLFFLMNV